MEVQRGSGVKLGPFLWFGGLQKSSREQQPHHRAEGRVARAAQYQEAQPPCGEAESVPMNINEMQTLQSRRGSPVWFCGAGLWWVGPGERGGA